MKKLLVIINDNLTDIINKGELTERYYNPGNLFGEVHIIMINSDKPNHVNLQKLVGTATLFLYNHPSSKWVFIRSLGWRPNLLAFWTAKCVELAKTIKPNLIRCHDDQLNGLIAADIKRKLGVPYIVSMHINPDEDILGRLNTLKLKMLYFLIESVKRRVLKEADKVLPVYQSILPYLNRLGAVNVEVSYNVLNSANLRKKNNYKLHDPIKIISVGRQIKEKNPDNILKAICNFPNVNLTLIGDGPIHNELLLLANRLGVEKRVNFIPALENDRLCDMLCDFDIFVTHSEYWEISKSVLEPLLVGLPVIINLRLGAPVPEFSSNFLILVSNTIEGYVGALNRLISDEEFRRELGENAYRHSHENWAPSVTERKFVSIYNKLMIN